MLMLCSYSMRPCPEGIRGIPAPLRCAAVSDRRGEASAMTPERPSPFIAGRGRPRASRPQPHAPSVIVRCGGGGRLPFLFHPFPPPRSSFHFPPSSLLPPRSFPPSLPGSISSPLIISLHLLLSFELVYTSSFHFVIIAGRLRTAPHALATGLDAVITWAARVLALFRGGLPAVALPCPALPCPPAFGPQSGL